MENRSPNSPLYNRKIKYCQFRIQEAISLRDDEIGRMANRLNQYKSLILEAKEKISDLSLKIQEESESMTGERKRRKAELSVAVARIKAQHHQSIHDIQRHQASEIDSIQQDFEIALKTLKQTTTFRHSNRILDVENEIKKVQAQIDTYRNERTKIIKQTTQVEVNERIEDINYGVIEQLQQIIQTRTEERFESLHQSKAKLAQCVDTIEDMIRRHTIHVNELQGQLKDMEERYEAEYQKLEEKHGYKTQVLKSHLIESQKRTNRLLHAAKRLDYENQKQLRSTIKELDGMKEKCYQISEDISGIDEQRKQMLLSLRTEIPRLKRGQKKLDEILDDKRRENEALRREIGQCQHVLKYGVMSV
ncbi:hypothetical protein TRFO_05185 [Tritrichomonas foetus]|uniref:Uncharacterized protein n=1 Tax=Tritrichomonas foetus TaxID=1144522 RepID=A0A1J4K824_9EUKA|nr:hypothetical protein TRFO_05185 [Tritrichomonas foetus]|eukprot:OHT07551.1 hypothetical protein TRFO_05185 [Tritrichomonas foetus]